jgi:hypothetical protein
MKIEICEDLVVQYVTEVRLHSEFRRYGIMRMISNHKPSFSIFISILITISLASA